jgi:RNA polymerase sigma factor (sigma-70 family)
MTGGGYLPDADDGFLLRATEANPEAFGVFYDRYVHGVLSYFYRRTSDSHTAADLTAETFAEALRGARRFEPERGEPKAWLYGIANHQLARYLRRRQVSEKYLKKLGIPTIHLDDVSIERIESMLDATPHMAAVVDGLQSLSPLVARAVVLRVVQELPFSEIGQILGCTPGAARVRVSRGISQLARLVNA